MRVRRAPLLIAAAVVGVAASAHAAIITYEYTGPVSNTGTIASLAGQTLTATFTVDTSRPGTPNAISGGTDFNFAVLDATVQVGIYTFRMKPYDQFNQAAAPTTTNRNVIGFARINTPAPGFDRMSVNTYADEVQVGNVTPRGMSMQIDDRFSGALVLPVYPEDFSGFTFGPGLDIASVSVGVQVSSTVSTIVSANGSVRVVPIPEPASLGLLGLVGGLTMLRPRR